MRTTSPREKPIAASPKNFGFTITELLVSLSVFSLALLGVLYVHLFGLRLSTVIQTKLPASNHARTACGRLMDDIRTAKKIQVGSGTFASFTPCADGTAQLGNAIQVQPSTNASMYVRYYLDAGDRKLKRMTNGATTFDTIAEFITNDVVFTSEDYRGTNLTASQNNRVIGVSMQFYQLQYPLVAIGASNIFDFYQLQTKITRRTVE